MTERPDLQKIHDYICRTREDLLDNIETLACIRLHLHDNWQIALDRVILTMLYATTGLKRSAGHMHYLGALHEVHDHRGQR